METASLCAYATANCVPATRQVHNVSRKSKAARISDFSEGRGGVCAEYHCWTRSELQSTLAGIDDGEFSGSGGGGVTKSLARRMCAALIVQHRWTCSRYKGKDWDPNLSDCRLLFALPTNRYAVFLSSSLP